MDVIHGTHSVWLVALSAATSVLGSYGALRVARLIVSDVAGRWLWIWAAAFALGGSAIWSTHFLGMLAFDLGLPVRYDLALTSASLLLAVATTAAGFRLVAPGPARAARCVVAGVVTGLGIAGMHYTGMAAMRVPATMSWNAVLVALSVVIAIVAAATALWLAFNLRGRWETLGGAVVMGAAVCSMHYTGMAAARFRPAAGPEGFARALVPELVGYSVFLMAVFTVVVVLTAAESPVRRLSRMVRALNWRGSAGVALVLVVPAIPLLAAWWGHGTLDRALRSRLADELQMVLQADVAALDIWMERQRHTAEAQARHPDVAALVRAIVAAEARQRPQLLRRLEGHVAPLADASRFRELAVFGRQGRLSADVAADAARREDETLLPFIRTVFEGRAGLSLPIRVPASGPGAASSSLLRMYAAAPVTDPAGGTIAVLAFAIDPEDEFYRILTVARSGRSGETYAFDRHGYLISPSRFVNDLAAAGLATSTAFGGVLDVRLSDPGGNVVLGYRPDSESGQPLTRMARAAVTGQAGLDVDGYRDYRGVPVIGAWTWLTAQGFGVATEVDVEEAFAGMSQVRRGLWALLTLLATGAFGLVVGQGAMRRLRHEVERAERLGQYTLEKRIGAGGMGVVYRARHAMLQRPTAVKLLQSQRADAQAVARFEREVQLTARLTHPNTIAVYDYGRTPDGIFYYAMEYLPGHTLDRLVALHGPQPEGRVIHILRQACGSLAEAHGVGLIHRDVKPSNIMLCDRGGQLDVVKVLDFGLVKDVGPRGDATLTHDGTFTGTPSYVSPEAVLAPGRVDGRSDLYCLGAVGYFLLTGQHVFEGQSAIAVIDQHLHAEPQAPSTRTKRPLSPDLEALIMDCLRKEPQRRPSSADALSDCLAACEAASWSQADARRWHAACPDVAPGRVPADAVVTSDLGVALSVDVRGRLGSTDQTGLES